MNLSFALWLALSGIIALFVMGIAWKHRTASGALAFVAVLLDLAVWSFSEAAYWFSTAPGTRAFWMRMTYVGVVFAPVVFFVLVQYIIRREGWLRWKAYLALFFIPLVTLFVLWIDPLSYLFFGEGNSIAPVIFVDGGPWFYVVVFYSYLLVGIGIFLLVRVHLYSPLFYVRQTRIFLVAALLPWTMNILTLLGANPFPGLDLTPIAFAIASLLIAYAFWGYRMMDLIPIGRDVLVENMDDAIVVVDTQGRIVDLNPKAREFANLDGEMPFGRPLEEVFPRWDKVTSLLHSNFEGRTEIKVNRPPFFCFELRVIPLKNRQEHVVGKLASWHDISTRKRAEEQLRIFFQAIEQNPAAIVITDPQGGIEYVNGRFTQITGFTPDEVHGQTPRILRSGETPDHVYKNLWATIKRGEAWEAEVLNRKKDGELYWAHELIAPVLDNNGEVERFVAMQENITERKHTESELRSANTRMQLQLEEIGRLHAQLREESVRDGLTRLFNRRYMEETLERELSRANRDAISLSVVMMDVDRFKSINDTYGHHTGDAVLQTLGTLLLENTRTSDIACRYGGDEMLVVLPGASVEDAVGRAEEWRAAFSLLEFSLPESMIRTSLSLGVASFPRHAHSPIELLVAADKALYKAKSLRNTVATYDPATMAVSTNRSDDIR